MPPLQDNRHNAHSTPLAHYWSLDVVRKMPPSHAPLRQTNREYEQQETIRVFHVGASADALAHYAMMLIAIATRSTPPR